MAEKLSSGHSISEIKGDEANDLKSRYFLYTDGIMSLHPGNIILPINFKKYADKIYNFEVKPTDIFVTAFPKSGTTWAQEIVWNLVLNPQLDHPMANSSLDQKYHTIEGDFYMATTGVPPPDSEGELMQLYQKLYPGKSFTDGFIIGLAAFAPSPRFFKSHLPISLLPKKTLETAKIVHIIRDPRDVVSSYFHYARLQILMGFEGSLNEFVEDAINERIPYASYWENVKEAWDKRNHPNLCLVYYENLKKDPLTEIKRIDKFLGTKRNDKELEAIVNFTKFESMKDRFKEKQPTSHSNVLFEKEIEKNEGGFFRKGKCGDWKERFSTEQIEKLNKWMDINLAKFGEDFKYKV